MKASWYRPLVLALTSLLTFSFFTPALAAQPEFFIFTVDQTTEIGQCGDFALIEHFEGQVKASVHTDQEGNFVMEVQRVRLRHTITNSVTGESLFSPDVGVDKVSVSQTGDTTLAQIGILARIVVPGEGLVFASLGRIVFNLDTGEVLFEAGRHDDFANLIPTLCAVLE